MVFQQKFSEDSKMVQQVNELGDAMKALNIGKEDIQKLKYESFINELKNSKCKNYKIKLFAA